MDNITHAFVGAAMAECALPRGAAQTTRQVFMVAGVAAASAPDLDLLYTSVTAAPLGYLLHHRGHTHTLPGLTVLGGLILAAFRLWPAARAVVAETRARVVLLASAALLSHLLLDAANSYGTHLLYPFSSRWYYGDAVFVLEPWVWLILGAMLALNARRRAVRVCVWLLTVAAVVALGSAGLASTGLMAALLAAGAAGSALARSWRPRRRAAVALAGTAVIFLALFAASRIARDEARRAIERSGGVVGDVVLNPNPGVPWCWSVVTIERTPNGDRDALAVRRGTVSLLRSAWPASSCASHRLLVRRSFGEGGLAPDGSASVAAADAVVWNQHWRIDIAELRALDAADCRVRAWLQFGRVPFVGGGRIADLRFENPLGANFTAMAVGAGSPGCPANLTDWDPPRRDILGR